MSDYDVFRADCPAQMTLACRNCVTMQSSKQLRELEADGILSRTVHEQLPPHVVYDVAPEERAHLDAVLGAMCNWGLYWCAKTGARIIARDG